MSPSTTKPHPHMLLQARAACAGATLRAVATSLGRRQSEHVVDAHVVAVAVEAGGGIVLTGDADDLARFAAPYRSVLVESLVEK